MKRELLVRAFLTTQIIWVSVLSAAGQQAWLNEINIADGVGDSTCRFVELRGEPNSLLTDLSFLLVEGDAGGNPGEVIISVDLGEAKFGSNGLLIITAQGGECSGSSFPKETAHLKAANFEGLSGHSQSFLLVYSFQKITVSTDLDVENNGELEGLPGGSAVVDAFGWTDGYDGDLVYGGVDLERPPSTPDSTAPQAATRFPDNLTPLSTSSWYYGNIGNIKQSPAALIPYDNEIVSRNFPANGGLTPGAPNAPHPTPIKKTSLDFNGDGKTDYAVVRTMENLTVSAKTSGLTNQGSSSQSEVKTVRTVNWLIKLNGFETTVVQSWGLDTDEIVPADYDGDGRTDIAFWRAAAKNTSAFYILESANNTLRVVPLGEAGDNPLVVADYDGDGRADPAVYRPGTGRLKSVWLYLASSDGDDKNQVRGEEWGIGADMPAPGDYDGDGRADFCIRRAEKGAGVFHLKFSSTSRVEQIKYGLATDEIVRGDYDGDGRADFFLRRTGKKNNLFLFRKSSGQTEQLILGQPGDKNAPGDYDGDGRTDIAVWRPETKVFWIKASSAGATSDPVQFKWGEVGDLPVAAFSAE